MLSYTSQKNTHVPLDMSGKRSINDGNNAFSLRHKIHDLGQIGKQNTQYVTDAQTRYKWVQPAKQDMGTTASMGLVADRLK